MADNTTLPAAGGGDTVRTVEREGAKPVTLPAQRQTSIKTETVSIDVGGERGPADSEQIVSPLFPMPVEDPAVRINATYTAQMAAMAQASAGGAGFYPIELPNFLVGVQ